MSALTYERFFGLSEKPFSLSSDPKFLYRSPSHAVVFDKLLNGIERREGVLVLTGDIGTGKTTLCRAVLQSLPRKTFSAFVPDPFATREDLLKMLLIDFGVMSVRDLANGHLKGATRAELSYLLYDFLETLIPLDAFVVMIVDEAQNLSLSLIEEIRILSDLHGRTSPLQVLFVGQLELRDKLKLPEMRQVDQRVSVHCSLEPLTREALPGYVGYRLGVAGAAPESISFGVDALDAVFDASRGVPRLINRICDRTMQQAFLARSMALTRAMVEAAIREAGGAELPGTLTAAPASAASAAPHASAAPPASAAPLALVAPPVRVASAAPIAPTISAAPIAPATPAAPTAIIVQTASAPAPVEAPAPCDVDGWLKQIESVQPPPAALDGLGVFAPEAAPDVLRRPRQPQWFLGTKTSRRGSRAGRRLHGWGLPAVPAGLTRRMLRVSAAGLILVGALSGMVLGMSRIPAVVDEVALPLPPAPATAVQEPRPSSLEVNAVEHATTVAANGGAGTVSAPAATAPAAMAATAPIATGVTPPVQEAAPAPAEAGFVLEVALFGSSQRGARLVDELIAEGFRAFQQPLDLGPRGSFQQVLIGQFETRAEAERDLERLRQRGGHDDARIASSVRSQKAAE